MEILGYELKKKEDSVVQESTIQPPSNMKAEITFADSSYFEKYQYKPYNPSQLFQRYGNYNLFDDMRTDDQIKCTLQLKKLITLNSDWIIDCEDENVVEFITLCLTEYLDDSFNKKLYQILSAMDYGFSITEKILGNVDYNGSQKWAFTKLKTRAPHTFELPTDNQGNLNYLLQHTAKEDIKLDPKKFIVYSYQKEFDNPYGNSELDKGVYNAYWAKQAIMKFWGIHLERYGSPLAVGKIPNTAGTQDKNTFKTILTNIQAKTGITLPEGYELEYLKGSEGRSSYREAIDSFNLMIARSMLLPDLVGFSGGQTGGGSYSLGKEQFNIFYTTIQYIRQDIERIVNTEIIYPLVVWNFGNNVQAKFKFQQIDEARKEKDMDLWVKAVQTGKIPVTNEHINHFLNVVDFPEVDEEELNRIAEEKKEIAESIQGGMNEKEESEDKEKPTEKKKGDDKKEKPTPKEFAKSDYFRELTVYEKRSDIKKLDREQQEIEKKYLDELGKAYRLVINGLVNDVKKKKIMEKKRFDQINKLELRHMNKTLILWTKLLRESYMLGKNSVTKEYALIDPALLDNEDVVEWLKQEPEYVNETISSDILKQTRGTLINGVRSGDSIKDMVSQLAQSLKGYDSTITNNKIDMIVRTEVNRAFNQARTDQFGEMGDEISAYQYSAIMDGRTSAECSALDGKVFPSGELSLYQPPNHYRCRSLVVPIFKDEEFEIDKMPNMKQTDGSFLTLVKEKK